MVANRNKGWIDWVCLTLSFGLIIITRPQLLPSAFTTTSSVKLLILAENKGKIVGVFWLDVFLPIIRTSSLNSYHNWPSGGCAYCEFYQNSKPTKTDNTGNYRHSHTHIKRGQFYQRSSDQNRMVKSIGKMMTLNRHWLRIISEIDATEWEKPHVLRKNRKPHQPVNSIM